ncbi:hypothetical protein HDU93_003014 [Gonapodya sp. JEL0774]|nr:hypothetical protein HDU93_003014 [Gonapodya sp. JEL0774]
MGLVTTLGPIDTLIPKDSTPTLYPDGEWGVVKPENITHIEDVPVRIEQGLWYGPEMEKASERWCYVFTDKDVEEVDAAIRAYQSSGKPLIKVEKEVHSCDIVGLLCLSTSETGGESMVASLAAIYNEMREKRPDLVQVLMLPFYRDRKGEKNPNDAPVVLTPGLTWHGGHLIVRYSRSYLRTSHRHPGVPPLSALQLEALDMFEDLAQKHALHMVLEPGDIQFVLNHTIVHDRLAFQNSDTHTRHLLRLWLSAGGHDGAWDLPWDPVPGGSKERGGVKISGAEWKVPLEAE